MTKTNEKKIKTSALSWLKFLAKFSFSFLIIGYMIYSDRLNLHTVKAGFMNPWVMSSSLLLILLGSIVAIFRWKLLMRAQGIDMGFIQTLRYGFIGSFFSTTMPGIVSGDVVKAWYVIADRAKGQKKTPILTAIIIDRIIGLFGLITVSMIAMLAYWPMVWGNVRLQSIATINFLMALVVVFFFLSISFSDWGPWAWLRAKMTRYHENRIGSAFLKAYDAWSSYRENPRILWGSLVYAALTHSCVVLAILFCSRALGEDHMRAYQIFLLAPIGLLSTALPIAPAGLGVGHVAFNALFLTVGSKLGAEIFTLFVAQQILINLSGVFFYMRTPRPVETMGGTGKPDPSPTYRNESSVLQNASRHS